MGKAKAKSKGQSKDKDGDGLTRIAIVEADRCKPKKCRQECKKSCPVVKIGKLCIEVAPTSKLSYISEELCIGCGICVKVSRAVALSIAVPLRRRTVAPAAKFIPDTRCVWWWTNKTTRPNPNPTHPPTHPPDLAHALYRNVPSTPS